jgi:hypothetical protein
MTSSPTSDRITCVSAAMPPTVHNVSQRTRKRRANAAPPLVRRSVDQAGRCSGKAPAIELKSAPSIVIANTSPTTQQTSHADRMAAVK